MAINLNNKTFKSLENSANGEVSDQTFFHYQQEGQMLWAHYAGGSIRKGFLIGKIIDDQLEFSYQHLNHALEIMTGKCTSRAVLNPSGKIQLYEAWEWTCRDFSKGTSVLLEI